MVSKFGFTALDAAKTKESSCSMYLHLLQLVSYVQFGFTAWDGAKTKESVALLQRNGPKRTPEQRLIDWFLESCSVTGSDWKPVQSVSDVSDVCVLLAALMRLQESEDLKEGERNRKATSWLLSGGAHSRRHILFKVLFSEI